MVIILLETLVITERACISGLK